MKLILRTDVGNLGESGAVVDVKDGYARNYLIPQGLAYAASDKNLRRLEAEQARAEEAGKRDYLEARRRASQMEGLSLTFQVKAGEEGKLFGSVTNADIVEKLNKGDLDFEVDRRQIVMDDPLKQLGVFEIPIRLHAQVDVTVEVRTERMDD